MASTPTDLTDTPPLGKPFVDLDQGRYHIGTLGILYVTGPDGATYVEIMSHSGDRHISIHTTPAGRRVTIDVDGTEIPPGADLT